MGWLTRWTGRRGQAAHGASGGGAGAGSGPGEVQQHLAAFARSRTGVEAYLEPATTVTPATMLLVAGTGEWTRRPVPDPRTAEKFAKDLGVPVFDVNLSGYPSRMREWNARVKDEEANARREIDGR